MVLGKSVEKGIDSVGIHRDMFKVKTQIIHMSTYEFKEALKIAVQHAREEERKNKELEIASARSEVYEEMNKAMKEQEKKIKEETARELKELSNKRFTSQSKDVIYWKDVVEVINKLKRNE